MSDEGVYILYREGQITGFSDSPREDDDEIDACVGPISLEVIAAAPRLKADNKSLRLLMESSANDPDRCPWCGHDLPSGQNAKLREACQKLVVVPSTHDTADGAFLDDIFGAIDAIREALGERK